MVVDLTPFKELYLCYGDLVKNNAEGSSGLGLDLSNTNAYLLGRAEATLDILGYRGIDGTHLFNMVVADYPDETKEKFMFRRKLKKQPSYTAMRLLKAIIAVGKACTLDYLVDKDSVARAYTNYKDAVVRFELETKGNPLERDKRPWIDNA